MLQTSKRRKKLKGLFYLREKYDNLKVENSLAFHTTQPGPLMLGVYLDLIPVLYEMGFEGVIVES